MYCQSASIDKTESRIRNLLATDSIMIQITASVVSGFEVTSFWAAFVGAIFMSIISFILSFFINDKGSIETIIIKREE